MPVAPDLAGAALDGRYEIHTLIGEGTFGRVYRGLDRRLQREVAIKVIKPWWGEDPDWAARFEREAQLLARVNDPGIVQVFDVGQCEDGLYYVAELVEGESLADRLAGAPLSPEEARRLGVQLCRALAQLHAVDVIHRDIKPANVLLTRGGRVKLGDFSVARLGDASSEGRATVAGTPKYMAPEQARGKAATAATDIYSAGVVLYEMLAGRPPWPSGSPVELALHHLQDPPPPLPADVPEVLAAVTMRALEKQPERRYASAAAMAMALERARAGSLWDEPSPAAGGRGLSAPAPSPRGDRTRVAPALGPRRNVNPSARRRSAALLAAVVALGAGMALAAILLSRPARVPTPALRGLSRHAVLGAVARVHLRARFSKRFDHARVGTAIAQAPAPGLKVARNSTVAVVLSAGPPPVRLPKLTGEDTAAATAALAHLRLHATTRTVPAPGVAPGIVTGQTPLPGRMVRAGSTIALAVAEVPEWRPLFSFSGTDAGASQVFRIRGPRWRVIYRMSYVGTCTFIFVCSGPTAHVRDLRSGATTDFDLSDGGTQIRNFDFGGDPYRIDVTAGGDTARWSFQIQDRY